MNNTQKTLYGLNKDGSFKVWTIATQGNIILITHGKEGRKMQVKEELVYGKNIGKANETSDSQQANLEAESRYKKQLDKGYRTTKEELEELPLMPMLAQDYHKQGHRIKYPCWGSPKMDGVRCLAIKENGKVTLISRGNKEYHIPHIQTDLNSVMRNGDCVDGEIYYHGKFLEEIVSAVKKPNELTPFLDFIPFDIVNNYRFEDRLTQLIDSSFNMIDYVELLNEEGMKEYHKECVVNGYEGVMLRNCDGMYESGKRSADLQKYKEFIDEEFRIDGIEEDRNGNAVFKCWDHVAEAHFHVCYGDFDERKRQLEHPELYLGKMLTVQFQTRYKDSKLPQFPTGKVIRDYE